MATDESVSAHELALWLINEGFAEEIGGYGHATGEDIAEALLGDFMVIPRPTTLSTGQCSHINVTEKVYSGGNYGHYGTQRCLDCGAMRDDWSDWTVRE